jgi:hypothetical protein
MELETETIAEQKGVRLANVGVVDAANVEGAGVAVTGELATNVAGTGVYARPAHLFKPGQSGNPSGRPKSAKLYKEALHKRFSPEQLADYWHDALMQARTKQDAAAQAKILNHLTEQLAGKAVATNVTVKTKYEELMMLHQAAGEPLPDDGDIIDMP